MIYTHELVFFSGQLVCDHFNQDKAVLSFSGFVLIWKFSSYSLQGFQSLTTFYTLIQLNMIKTLDLCKMMDASLCRSLCDLDNQLTRLYISVFLYVVLKKLSMLILNHHSFIFSSGGKTFETDEVTVA